MMEHSHRLSPSVENIVILCAFLEDFQETERELHARVSRSPTGYAREIIPSTL